MTDRLAEHVGVRSLPAAQDIIGAAAVEDVAIVGAGPSGLSAAYHLARLTLSQLDENGFADIVLDNRNDVVNIYLVTAGDDLLAPRRNLVQVHEALRTFHRRSSRPAAGPCRGADLAASAAGALERQPHGQRRSSQERQRLASWR